MIVPLMVLALYALLALGSILKKIVRRLTFKYFEKVVEFSIPLSFME